MVSLLKEGCGIRGISRVLKISKNTVLSRMLKISHQIQVPYFNKFGYKFEVDEMFIKLANGRSQNWLIYAIEQKTKNVIGFVIGNRSKENLKYIIDKVLLLNPQRVYIERMNLNLRTHIKRLSRKTICFTRNQKYLEAHLKIYFWG